MFIKEIILETKLLNELRKFYSDILELEIIKSDENTFSVNAGKTIITFNTTNGSNAPFYHYAFNIPENQFHEAKSWAKERVKLISLDRNDEFDFKSWNAHSIYFYDPAGNIIEFIARHNLQNSSNKEFSANTLLSISEIGIPVKDVKSFFEFVSKKFSTPFFSGDLKTFTAAGDDNGLFIIVPEERSWFPAGGNAEIFPLSIILCGKSNTECKFENLPYTIVETSDC